MPVHVCDSTRPVCACGRRWEYRCGEPGSYRYTSAAVVERYRALYGEHDTAVLVTEQLVLREASGGGR